MSSCVSDVFHILAYVKVCIDPAFEGSRQDWARNLAALMTINGTC